MTAHSRPSCSGADAARVAVDETLPSRSPSRRAGCNGVESTAAPLSPSLEAVSSGNLWGRARHAAAGRRPECGPTVHLSCGGCSSALQPWRPPVRPRSGLSVELKTPMEKSDAPQLFQGCKVAVVGGELPVWADAAVWAHLPGETRGQQDSRRHNTNSCPAAVAVSDLNTRDDKAKQRLQVGRLLRVDHR